MKSMEFKLLPGDADLRGGRAVSPVAEWPTTERRAGIPWRDAAGAALVAAVGLGRLAVSAAALVLAVAVGAGAFLLGCCL